MHIEHIGMTLYTFRRGGATLVTHDIIQHEYTSNYRTIAVSINGAIEVRLMSRYRHSTAPSTIQGPPARHGRRIITHFARTELLGEEEVFLHCK